MNASIDLRRAQHAVWLAQELNFSRAAARACLSPTAFSRSIQALEASLGLQLFERGTRHVTVTAAGAQWLTQARTALVQAGYLMALAADLAQGDGGELRIGATPLGVDGALVPALLALRQRRLRLHVHVESGQWHRLMEKLQSDQIELFVGYPGAASDQRGCRVWPLAAWPLSVYARSQHPLASVDRCGYGDLLAYPWACVQMAPSLRAKLQALAGDTELPLAMETDNQTLLRSALLQTDTLLLTWPQWLQDDLASGCVVDVGARLQPPPPAALLALPCAVVHRSDRSLSPAAQQLLQWLMGTASN